VGKTQETLGESSALMSSNRGGGGGVEGGKLRGGRKVRKAFRKCRSGGVEKGGK